MVVDFVVVDVVVVDVDTEVEDVMRRKWWWMLCWWMWIRRRKTRGEEGDGGYGGSEQKILLKIQELNKLVYIVCLQFYQQANSQSLDFLICKLIQQPKYFYINSYTFF